MKLLVKKLYPDAVTPSRAHSTDSGLDLYYYSEDKSSVFLQPFVNIYPKTGEYLTTVDEAPIYIDSWEVEYSQSNAMLLSTGIAVKLPKPQYIRVGSTHGGNSIDRAVYTDEKIVYEAQVRSKSGLAVKFLLQTHFGTIDSAYTGEVKVFAFNHSHQNIEIKHGQKIAQLVVSPVFIPDLELVDSFEETERNSNGFGSTGVI